jgi:hypothetical protein
MVQWQRKGTSQHGEQPGSGASELHTDCRLPLDQPRTDHVKVITRVQDSGVRGEGHLLGRDAFGWIGFIVGEQPWEVVQFVPVRVCVCACVCVCVRVCVCAREYMCSDAIGSSNVQQQCAGAMLAGEIK